MKRMTLKTYAVKHKMSLFQVIKAVRNGTLPSETVEENGKEVTYVLVRTDNDDRISGGTDEDDMNLTLKREVEMLKNEVEQLKREMQRLRKLVGGGVML
jgi:hypothetical protein